MENNNELSTEVNQEQLSAAMMLDTSAINAALLKRLEAMDDPNADFSKEMQKTQATVSIATAMVNTAKVKIDAVRTAHNIVKHKAAGRLASIPGGSKAKKIGNG
jgi:hypothetical protein